MTLHSVLIQKLLSTNAHLGRRVVEHHFKVYTYGVRNGQTIIDSDKTLICLRNAANFIAHLAREKNARFMFVNTNPLFDDIVEQMTKKIGLYSPRDSMIWKMGGFLTNSYSPKKFRSRNKKLCFGPVQPPDCVVVLDTERKSSVILEADKLQIPIVALVDSSMPWEYYKKIAYPVPANDSVQFVYLFCNLITKTFLLEKKKMKALKDDGIEEDLSISGKASSKEVQQIEQSESEISSPVDEVLVVPYQSLASVSNGDVDIGETKKLLEKLVVVKFNNALGTTMGYNGPKIAVEVCGGLTLLDLLVNQIESINSKYGCHVPLVLMNTDKTHEDTLKLLKSYSKANVDIYPLKQGQQELLDGRSLKDELHPSDHAAAFLSLMKSGTLDLLLSQGKEYVYVVNSDNASATIDPKILNHLLENKIEYCMEVTPITSDNSTNNIISQQQERFKITEITQDPTKQSAEKFKLVDTRSMWMDLKAIKRLVDTYALKGIDGDTANLALRLFDHAIGINIPQSWFAPVTGISDLLLLQSDLYSFSEGILVRNKARTKPENPSIFLGPEFGTVSDLLHRFKSIPSMVHLDMLRVTGDVWFGAGVVLKGKVNIVAKPGMKLEIPDGAVLENKVILDPEDARGGRLPISYFAD